jgi:hypothetical protein
VFTCGQGQQINPGYPQGDRCVNDPVCDSETEYYNGRTNSCEPIAGGTCELTSVTDYLDLINDILGLIGKMGDIAG